MQEKLIDSARGAAAAPSSSCSLWRLTFSRISKRLLRPAVSLLQNYHCAPISMSRHCRESGNTLTYDRPASGAKRDLKPSREAPIAQPDGRGLSLGGTMTSSWPRSKSAWKDRRGLSLEARRRRTGVAPI
jgi:hypothetical protein